MTALSPDELRQLREPPGDECNRCHQAVSVPAGYEPTSVCNSCAQEVLPELLDAAEARSAIALEAVTSAAHLRLAEQRIAELERQLEALEAQLETRTRERDGLQGTLNHGLSRLLAEAERHRAKHGRGIQHVSALLYASGQSIIQLYGQLIEALTLCGEILSQLESGQPWCDPEWRKRYEDLLARGAYKGQSKP